MDVENHIGVKRAAKRKLEQELGIELNLDDFNFLTRIHYQAPSDVTWGEHEIDYILFAVKDVESNPNPNEVSQVKYVTPGELQEMVRDADTGKLQLTPWFRLITDTFLMKWWNNLNNLDGFVDSAIHRL